MSVSIKSTMLSDVASAITTYSYSQKRLYKASLFVVSKTLLSKMNLACCVMMSVSIKSTMLSDVASAVTTYSQKQLY